jgi:Ca2+/H+ antiporter, TMEM165/GDT1 family
MVRHEYCSNLFSYSHDQDSTMNWVGLSSATVSAALASFVEFVEALTVIFAVAATRSWRAALQGALAGLVTLILLISFLGNSIQKVPVQWMQIGVGLLIAFFGLKWLIKATLRSAGKVPLHDEAQLYLGQVSKLRSPHVSPFVIGEFDLIGVAVTFKIVLLEGTEVVLIVVTAGNASGHQTLACIGAAIALLLVIVLGLLARRPLSKVPENTLKKTVGILLSALGTFWIGEGLGYGWPAGEFFIFVLALTFLAVSWTISNILKPGEVD